MRLRINLTRWEYERALLKMGIVWEPKELCTTLAPDPLQALNDTKVLAVFYN